jgi:HK97 gp10 family phage protein
MASRPEAIRIDNLRETAQAFRRAERKDLGKKLRLANKDAVEVVKDEAKSQVPVRSGRLRKSINTQASQTSASVKAGSAARVPYAGVIHFGWGRKGIHPQPFLFGAVAKKYDEVVEAYEKNIDKLKRDLSS